MHISVGTKRRLINVFGFIWQQPLHKTLKDMAVVQVCLIISSQIMLIKIVNSLETIADEFKSTAYTAIAVLLIGQIFTAVFGIRK